MSGGVRVCVLSTSYPRGPDDVAGLFVADGVESLRAAGVHVEVVSPASFRHFGLAYGAGIPGNLRARPWKALALPFFFLAFLGAARRGARQADLVHAHWLPSGLVGLLTGRPTVVQLWGTDVELARRMRPLARAVLRRARLTIVASSALAYAAHELGAREVRVIPSGVELPEEVPDPEDPPHVLYVGRLSPEKGVLELVEAARGLPLVVVGDGPLRERVPGALGFVPHAGLGPFYARAAVVAVPSLREGYGMACAEAMAYGRPVVATAVGGLLDLVEDGVTGLLVPPGDVPALRAAFERLLDDPELRARLGAAARARAREGLSRSRAAEATISAYREAVR